MTPCRKKKVDFSKIFKKKTIKNRITKKQLDRKSHQKKTKKNCIFLSFFSFLFCWRVVFFLFFIVLFLFFPWFGFSGLFFWFALCFFLWNPINSLCWTHKSSVQIIRPVSTRVHAADRNLVVEDVVHEDFNFLQWAHDISPWFWVFWVLSVSVLKKPITGWVWNVWSAHQ